MAGYGVARNGGYGMTAKRFRFYQDIYEVMYVEDMQGNDIKLAHEEDMNPKDAIKVVELLNALHEENEQLKKRVTILLDKNKGLMNNDSYDRLLEDYHLVQIRNELLKYRLEKYDRLMKKYQIKSVELLDKMLMEQTVW